MCRKRRLGDENTINLKTLLSVSITEKLCIRGCVRKVQVTENSKPHFVLHTLVVVHIDIDIFRNVLPFGA